MSAPVTVDRFTFHVRQDHDLALRLADLKIKAYAAAGGIDDADCKRNAESLLVWALGWERVDG